jgi:1-acyl-sn-glycerol-3-phosphate acyltransferase
VSLRWMNRGWRIVGTGLCFVVFGMGSLVLTLIAAPALWLLVRAPEARKRRAQRILSAACRCFVGFMHYSGVLDYRITGREHLRHPGALIVANHPSLIDAIFLIALMPEVDCVINQQLWHNPFIGGPVRLAGYISNGTGPELVDRCSANLRAGYRLIIFPEGTRTRPGQPLHFERGAANIAIHADADVVPVLIKFKQTTLTKGDSWYHVPTHKVDISISAEPPIAVQPYMENNTSQPLAARELTRDLYAYYSARLA